MKQGIKKVVIAGGGTAGWIAGVSLAKLLGKNLDITLVESDEISTVGVGEATIPPLITLHRLLKINEQEFMAATSATFKLGISFENWRNVNEDYIHSFGTTGQDCWAGGFQHFWLKGKEEGISTDYADYCPEVAASLDNKFAITPKQSLNYAYHLDATAYAKFLRKFAEENGLKRVEGKIETIQTHQENGFIKSLTLASGQVIEGDLFIDCTGFRGLLIEQTLHSGYDDWSHWLPCDSALAVQTKAIDEPIPYTRSIGREAGWQWRIPLQHRVGNGLVYCSKYQTDESARETLLSNVQGETITEPLQIRFRTGTRRKHWNKNCVALGLASGFVEPLESTSIHMIQKSIIRLMQMFPLNGIEQTDIDEFNDQTFFELENIRDFIILHYFVTNRDDTPFWRHCANMSIPDSLSHRIELFRETGRVFHKQSELFGENSWVQVMLGQGITPRQYHPIADMMTREELTKFLEQHKQRSRQIAEQLPNHAEFVAHYCPTKVS